MIEHSVPCAQLLRHVPIGASSYMMPMPARATPPATLAQAHAVKSRMLESLTFLFWSHSGQHIVWSKVWPASPGCPRSVVGSGSSHALAALRARRGGRYSDRWCYL